MKKSHVQYRQVKESVSLDHLPTIKGYDYERNEREGFDLNEFVSAMATTGFQAANLAAAVRTVEIMKRERAVIFLASTSNMVSSGCREAITYLVKKRAVHCVIITAGGVEEDVIKLLKPFVTGSFEASGEHLFRNGINRTGNIFVPNDRYALFDKFMQGFLKGLYERERVVASHAFTRELGLAVAKLERKGESFLYWAARNKIPVICPALMDGAIGDLVHFFRQQHPAFRIDASEDLDVILKLVLNAEKAGGIILGGGVAKHYVLNANIFREGLDYTVYINTGEEFDGSDSGARIDEAISWGKVKPRSPAVKVHCDATIAFPLLVAATFARRDSGSEEEKKEGK